MAGPLDISKTSSSEIKNLLLYDDEKISQILKQVRTIAMIGASPNWERPSNISMRYLQGKGYRVIPVNPGHVGKYINGEKAFFSIGDIPFEIDMINIFRSSSQVNTIADEVLSLYSIKAVAVVWMQLGIQNNNSAKRLEDAGINVIMNRCPKIEYNRLFGELSWSEIY